MTSRSKKYNYNIFLDGDLSTNNLNLGISTIFSGSFAASNNVVTPQNVTGLSFSNSATRSFQCQLSVTMTRSVGGNLYELFSLEGHQTDSGWNLYPTSLNDITGVVFSITSNGQIQYTSTNVNNFVNCIFRFVVTQIANAGTYSNLSSGTQGTYLLNSIQVLNTTNSILGTTPGALYVLGGSTFEKQLVIKTTQNAVGLGTGGALSVFGGTSISKDLLIGGNVGIGTVTPTATLDVNGSINANSLYVGGSISGGAGTASTFAYLTLTATDDAINLSTGSFVTYGGVTIQSPTDASSVTNGGSFLTYGGASVGKRLFVGSDIVGLSNSNTVGSIITTGGNVGIGTITPSVKLDVSGTIRATNVTTTTATTTNVISTNITTSNIVSTNVNTTNVTTSNIVSTNVISTNITTSNFVSTNVNTTNITTSNIVSTNVNTTNVTSNNFVSTNVTANTYSGGSMSLSGNLTLAGTLTTVNITTTNLSQTNVSTGTLTATNITASNIVGTTVSSGTFIGNNVNVTTGTVGTLVTFTASVTNSSVTTQTVGVSRITTNFLALGNSNTVGNIYTTGGNVGIGTTSPSDILHIRTSNADTNIGTVIQNGSRQYRIGVRGDSGNLFAIQDDTAAAMRLVINTTGNIGIGTTSPVSRLHLASSSTAANIVFEPGTTADGAAANNGWAAINFNGYFSGTEQRINTSKNRWRFVCDQRTTEDKLFLETYNGSATTNLLTFTTVGNVGVGTQNPAVKLHMDGGDLRITQTSNYGNNFGLNLVRSGAASNNTDWYIYVPTGSGDLRFYNAGNLMTITTAGNVGIGTNTPSYRLDVSSSTTPLAIRMVGSHVDGAVIRYENTASGGRTYHVGSTATGSGAGTGFSIYDVTSGLSRMLIDSSGNIGVGRLSPTYRLEVDGNIGSYSGAFYGLDEAMFITTNTEFELIRTRNGAGIWGKKLGSNNEGCLLFKTHSLYNTPLTRMIITDGGRVGVGDVTDPQMKLHVKDNIMGDVVRVENSSGFGYATIQHLNDAGNYAYVGLGGSSTGNLAGKYYLSNNSLTEVVLTRTGRVGINLRDPAYPLTVVGGAQSGNVLSYAGWYANYGWQNQTADYLTSIYGQYFVIAGYGFASFSDNRIKKNIVDIDDVSALEVIRQIQPKRYSYIDEVRKGTQPVWGFIAQQVKGVLDYATSTITEFVPNVYDKANVVKTSDNTILITLQSKTLDLDLSDNATGKIRLYSFNQGSDDKELRVTIKDIISQNSFTIQETDVLQDVTECFVWGQEIKDFNVLNKDAVFTVSVAALQEVDRELQATRAELAETRSQLQDLLERVAALENK